MNIKGILFISFILLVFSLAAASASDLGHVAISDSHSDSSIAHVPVTVSSHDDSVIIDDNLDDVAVDDSSIDDGQSVPDDDSTIDDGGSSSPDDKKDSSVDVDGDINDGDSIIINITNDTPKNNYNDKPISNVKEAGGSFDDLQSLIDQSPKGTHLVLSRDYKGAKGKQVEINKDFVLDGQGHTIDCAYVCRAIYSSSGNIVLRNLNIINGHYDTDCSDDKTNNGGAICIGGNAKYTIENCNFTNNWADDMGGAIYNGVNNTPVIRNCVFKNNEVDDVDGGAIYSVGSVDIESCIFSCNLADDNGGAICSLNYAYVYDSIFCDNWACDDGGALYSGQSSIWNSKFQGNYAEDDGGALYSGWIEMVNSTFEGNIAEDDGGAIYSDGYVKINTVLTGCKTYFIDNKALDGKGGAVYCEKSFKALYTEFNSNTALVDGGAIYSRNVTPKYCDFYFNRAEGAVLKCYGGAIRANLVIDMMNCVFKENYCENHGGAIYTEFFRGIQDHCTFYFNQAGEDGGAVYLNSESLSFFFYCIFVINRCLDQGGAIYADSSFAQIDLEDNLFKGNHAENEGHVVFNYGTYFDVRENWWADNLPTGENGLLVEHKYFSPNINHVDYRPVRLVMNCSSTLTVGKKAKATLYFEEPDGSLAVCIPLLMEFVVPSEFKVVGHPSTVASVDIEFIPEKEGVFTIYGNLYGELVSVTATVTADSSSAGNSVDSGFANSDSSFAGNSVASGFANANSSIVKNTMVNTQFVKSLGDFSKAHDDFSVYSPWLLILSIFGL